MSLHKKFTYELIKRLEKRLAKLPPGKERDELLKEMQEYQRLYEETR